MKENVTIGDIRDFRLQGGTRVTGIIVENNYTMAALKIAGGNGFSEIPYGDIEGVESVNISPVQRETLEKIYKYYRMHKKLSDKKAEIDSKLDQLEKAMKGNMVRVQIEDRGYTDSEFAMTLIRLLHKETGGEIGAKGYTIKFKRVGTDELRVYVYRNKPLTSEVAFYIEKLKSDIEISGTKASKESLERAIHLLGEDNFKYYTRHGVSGVHIKEDTDLKDGVYRHIISIDIKAEKLTRNLIKNIANGMTLVKK